MNKAAKVSLIIGTVCILLICVMQLVAYFETGEAGGIVSTICFAISIVCMVIAWISYFINNKKQQ